MPGATPVYIPVAGSIVALDVGLLLHTPPLVISLSVAELPTQTEVIPVIIDGGGFTVTTTVAMHPLLPV